MSVATPWERGRLDGRDGPEGRIFCIASAGCMALALAARGFPVTAVDINPAQIDYARARAAGAPARPGVVDRRLGQAHRAMPWLGLSVSDRRRFFELSSSDEQMTFWKERLDTVRFRALLRIALMPAILRMSTGRSLVDSLPPRFDRVIFDRLERTWSRHPNHDNPYARRLLLGFDPAPAPPASNIDFICADAAEFLDHGPPNHYDGFTLSNIIEAVPPAYRERLLAAVRRAAAPGAIVVVRSLAEARDDKEAEWAARDRSPLWGTVEVTAL